MVSSESLLSQARDVWIKPPLMIRDIRFLSDLGFFFNDTATTEIYTLSLHDALPIPYTSSTSRLAAGVSEAGSTSVDSSVRTSSCRRSEEHTSELQSLAYLVCRL